MNRVILVGNLGEDPKTIKQRDSKMVSRFSLATTSTHNDKKITEWHDVVCFDRLAEISNDYLRKGSKCLIEGRLHRATWKDQRGQQRQKVEVVASNVTFLDSRTSRETVPHSREEEDYFTD